MEPSGRERAGGDRVQAGRAGTPGRRRIASRLRSLAGVRAAPSEQQDRPIQAHLRSLQPRFATAVLADARVTARRRGERDRFRSRLDALVQVVRLSVVTDAFFGQCCYRAQAACHRRRIPVVPRLFHHLAMTSAQICIGDPVVVEPGVYIAHGQVVIGGVTHVSSGVSILPFVTIGLRGRMQGPTIGPGATIGTGARVIGPIRVGAWANVGANAVVLDDVPDRATAVGVPAVVLPAQGARERPEVAGRGGRSRC